MPRTHLLPRIPSWRIYERMYDKPRLWNPAIRHVLKMHGLPVERVSGSYFGNCAVFAVGKPGHVVLLKFFPPMLAGDQRIERSALDTLARRKAFSVPRVLAVGTLRDRSTWSYLVLQPLAGRPIQEVWARMRPAERLAAMRAIGAFLRRLHAVPAPDGVPALDMGLLARKALRTYRKADVFSPALMADLHRRLPALTESSGRPRRTFLHADLYELHAILNRQGGRWRLTGVIDFADAGTGDPLYEWAPVKFGFKRSHLTHFQAALRGYDPALRLTTRWRDRAVAFMLIHEFAPGTVLNLLKQDAVRTRDLTWSALRDWLLPPALERS